MLYLCMPVRLFLPTSQHVFHVTKTSNCFPQSIPVVIAHVQISKQRLTPPLFTIVFLLNIYIKNKTARLVGFQSATLNGMLSSCYLNKHLDNGKFDFLTFNYLNYLLFLAGWQQILAFLWVFDITIMCWPEYKKCIHLYTAHAAYIFTSNGMTHCHGSPLAACELIKLCCTIHSSSSGSGGGSSWI